MSRVTAGRRDCDCVREADDKVLNRRGRCFCLCPKLRRELSPGYRCPLSLETGLSCFNTFGYIYISATSSAVCVKFEPTSQWITAPVWKERVFWNVEVNSAAGVSMSVGLENANVTDSSRQLDQI